MEKSNIDSRSLNTVELLLVHPCYRDKDKKGSAEKLADWLKIEAERSMRYVVLIFIDLSRRLLNMSLCYAQALEALLVIEELSGEHIVT